MLSRNVNDTTRVDRMTIIVDAATWSVTYDRHSDNSRGISYDCDIFTTEATGISILWTTLSLSIHEQSQQSKHKVKCVKKGKI
jgi:hypothetical protein